jgi:hypothetical protein
LIVLALLAKKGIPRPVHLIRQTRNVIQDLIGAAWWPPADWFRWWLLKLRKQAKSCLRVLIGLRDAAVEASSGRCVMEPATCFQFCLKLLFSLK